MTPSHDVIQAAAVILSALQEAPGPVRRALLVEEIKRSHPTWSLSTCSRRFRDARSLLVHQGHPVMSDGAGFKLGTNHEETKERALKLRKAGIAQLREAAALERIPFSTLLHQAALEFGGGAP